MQKDFNEAFILLKKKYEEKERNPREIQTYELLKKMIKVYGYNSVCDKISLNRQNNKNNELGIFIDNVKQNMPLELLCSQLFYLDDSISFQPEDNSKENQNSKSKLNGNNKPRENIVLFKSERKDLNEIIN
jgi:hypothetical protein